MNEDLYTQLLTITSPEQADSYLRTVDLLDEIGSTTHLDTIEQHLGITDYQSGPEFNNMIRDTLERQLTYELGMFTVVLNPDVPYDMDFCVELLRGLYHMDLYPDGAALLAALEIEDNDMRESVYRIVNMITPIDEDEFFIQVTSIDPTLITRLKSVREELPEGVTEEVERLRDLVRERTRHVREKALHLYSTEDGVPISDGLMHIDNVVLGYDLAPALTLLSVRMFQQPIREAIADIALLTAASNVTNVAKAFNLIVERYIEEPNREALETIMYFNAILSEGLPNE